MANRTLFQSHRGTHVLPATDRNSHLAPAYGYSPKHALAQYASTGCLNHTFYASAGQQLDAVLALAREVETTFVSKLAIYSRQRAWMKDMPALLCAALATRDLDLHARVFRRVIDNAGMLRGYVQILRSGVTGRKSLGTAPKRLVKDWLASRPEDALFRQSAGQNPSLGDIVKMVHPKPDSDTRKSFYGYLLGRPVDQAVLPALVRQFEQFKAGESMDVPELPLPMLTALPLSKRDWIRLSRNLSWQALRMNLNTLARHGVFEDAEAVQHVAAKLRDRKAIETARVFPYQLMVANAMTGEDIPDAIRESLRLAMEIAVANVPRLDGQVYVCPDVSGSMQSPVTGYRKGATTAVRCVDVAALVASAVLRANRQARVIPFEQDVVNINLDPDASVLANAEALAKIGGGGTNCSAPLRLLNQERAKGDLVVFVSDNESWVDASQAHSGTPMMREWEQFRQRNPRARLICIDLQPNRTSQTYDRPDVLNIGGFSDQVFEAMAEFAVGRWHAGHWIGAIEAVEV
ncbi:MAG: TROVE domain-containing protein [Bryobacterales bacterium]|nr:TROVE domain-containing protein [Bryobacterales bacterium]